MEDTILVLYYLIDDFWKSHGPVWKKTRVDSGTKKGHRIGPLSASEIMTMDIHCHQTHYHAVKHYDVYYVITDLRKDFPG